MVSIRLEVSGWKLEAAVHTLSPQITTALSAGISQAASHWALSAQRATSSARTQPEALSVRTQ